MQFENVYVKHYMAAGQAAIEINNIVSDDSNWIGKTRTEIETMCVPIGDLTNFTIDFNETAVTVCSIWNTAGGQIIHDDEWDGINGNGQYTTALDAVFPGAVRYNSTTPVETSEQSGGQAIDPSDWPLVYMYLSRIVTDNTKVGLVYFGDLPIEASHYADPRYATFDYTGHCDGVYDYPVLGGIPINPRPYRASDLFAYRSDAQQFILQQGEAVLRVSPNLRVAHLESLTPYDVSRDFGENPEEDGGGLVCLKDDARILYTWALRDVTIDSQNDQFILWDPTVLTSYQSADRYHALMLGWQKTNTKYIWFTAFCKAGVISMQSDDTPYGLRWFSYADENSIEDIPEFAALAGKGMITASEASIMEYQNLFRGILTVPADRPMQTYIMS